MEQSLKRTDELLTELVDLVETARTVPMSGSCVVPRERMLDLLDALREILPPELDDARRVVATRDKVLHDAYEEATATRTEASADAAAMIEDAGQQSEALLGAAEGRAHDLGERAAAEHDRLISSTGVHQAATAAAAIIREQAKVDAAEIRATAERDGVKIREEAGQTVAALRAEAERYALKLRTDSEDYADRTLADLVASLQHCAGTAEQGRATLAQRRRRAQPQLHPGDPRAVAAASESTRPASISA
jgi:hypothetical protein